MARVQSLWRYPVKSMVGGEIGRAHIRRRGLSMDRTWCVTDVKTGAILSAKRTPALLGCKAEYAGADIGAGVIVTLPDGTELESRDTSVHQQLSDYMEREVRLSRVKPAWRLDYFRRRHPLTPIEMRMLLGVQPGKPLPDLSRAPLSTLLIVAFFESIPGTHFDAHPIHIVSEKGLRDFADRTAGDVGNSVSNPRRFRPNIIIDGVDDDLQGDEWIGRKLRIGNAELVVVANTIRCSMPARGQMGLPEVPSVSKSLRDNYEMHFGLYADVARPGKVTAGDAVVVEKPGKQSMYRATLSAAEKRIKRALIARLISS